MKQRLARFRIVDGVVLYHRRVENHTGYYQVLAVGRVYVRRRRAELPATVTRHHVLEATVRDHRGDRERRHGARLRAKTEPAIE